MYSSPRRLGRPVALLALAGVVAWLGGTGCLGGGSGWEFIGSPFASSGGSTGPTGPGNTGQTQGGQFGQADRTPVDPCTESQGRKFVTISMRNLTADYIHYFFVAVAFLDVDQSDVNASIPFFDTLAFPDGAICPADVALYRQFGYTIEIPAGVVASFGDYCLGGPAMVYYHRSGQFRRSAGVGSTGLGSAIAPAQGSSPTYDSFFTSAGAQVPVPDIILFHNPGTGEGAHLKISRQSTAPCDPQVVAGTAVCLRDAFYYVDDTDIMAGSSALGRGSGRRVPGEIQGTGCQCTGLSEAFQILAPSRVTARGSRCNEYFRAGRIEYVFLRDDEDPPYPQLVWKVSDASGATAHDFDERSGLP